jgi:hypothetical protein
VSGIKTYLKDWLKADGDTLLVDEFFILIATNFILT